MHYGSIASIFINQSVCFSDARSPFNESNVDYYKSVLFVDGLRLFFVKHLKRQDNVPISFTAIDCFILSVKACDLFIVFCDVLNKYTTKCFDFGELTVNVSTVGSLNMCFSLYM